MPCCAACALRIIAYQLNWFVMLCSDETPLILASREGYLPVVKHLLEHKANIEAKDDDGMIFEFCYSSSVWFLCVWWSRVFVDADAYG